MGQVSLFTREWIEIFAPYARPAAARASPSLRGSGLKSPALHLLLQVSPSPSLRGSGLKLDNETEYAKSLESPSLRGSGLKFDVSYAETVSTYVSLFTREWIEIAMLDVKFTPNESPSLRGSGLKLYSMFPSAKAVLGLPLYEGVD